jgi:acetoin utilization protein AcuB
MTPHPITLRMESDAQSALRTMQEHAIHHLPVLDVDERIAGIVAERDLLLAALRSPGASMDIADVVHRDVICIRDDMPVTHAATLMAKHTIGGLPVTDAKGRLVGVITETDLFRAFVEVMEAKMPRLDAALRSAADDALAAAPAVAVGRGGALTPTPAAAPAKAKKPNGKAARRV